MFHLRWVTESVCVRLWCLLLVPMMWAQNVIKIVFFETKWKPHKQRRQRRQRQRKKIFYTNILCFRIVLSFNLSSNIFCFVSFFSLSLLVLLLSYLFSFAESVLATTQELGERASERARKSVTFLWVANFVSNRWSYITLTPSHSVCKLAVLRWSQKQTAKHIVFCFRWDTMESI